MKRLSILFIIIFMALNSIYAVEIMTTDEITEGMTGYGLTVWKGTVPERFDVEIIGVMKNYNTDSDLILARCTGGILAQSGIQAGMSGSPVYIDGKLIGAVAYGWMFPKDAIAGIQPISNMLQVLRFKEDALKVGYNPEDFRHFSGVAPAAPVTAESCKQSTISEILHMMRGSHISENTTSPHNNHMVPLLTPVVFNGFDTRTINQLSAQFEPYDLMPVAGAGSHMNALSEGYTVQPGAACGIMMIRGDYEAAAIGTITWCGSNDILIFGHPMYHRGYIDAPLTGAYIHGVMPSYMRSFKLGSPIQEIGRAYADQHAAVAGDTSLRSTMIPVAIQLAYENTKKKYNVEIIRDPQFFSTLLVAVAVNSVLVNEGRIQPTTYHFTFDVQLSDGNVLTFKNSYAGIQSMRNLFEGLNMLMSSIDTLVWNEYKDVSVQSVALNIAADEGIAVGDIVEATAHALIYEPGETVHIQAVLQKYKGDTVQVPLVLPLPATLSPGEYTIHIAGGFNALINDIIANPARYTPHDYEHLLSIIKSFRPNTEIVAWIEDVTTGLIINGKEMPALPNSMYTVITRSSSSKAVKVGMPLIAEKKMAMVIEGQQQVTIRVVEDKNKIGDR